MMAKERTDCELFFMFFIPLLLDDDDATQSSTFSVFYNVGGFVIHHVGKVGLEESLAFANYQNKMCMVRVNSRIRQRCDL